MRDQKRRPRRSAFCISLEKGNLERVVEGHRHDPIILVLGIFNALPGVVLQEQIDVGALEVDLEIFVHLVGIRQAEVPGMVSRGEIRHGAVSERRIMRHIGFAGHFGAVGALEIADLQGVLEAVDEGNVLQVGNAAGEAAAAAMAKHFPGAQVGIAAAEAEGRDGPLGVEHGHALGTVVRIAVPRLESTPSMPTLPKMAVRLANTADNTA